MQETGSIPGPRRSLMHRTAKSIRNNYWACGSQQERPPECEAHTSQLEKAPTVMKTQYGQK